MDASQKSESVNAQPGAQKLLLSSLAEFWSAIEPLLMAAQPKTLCEIGVAQGEFTALLLNFCQKHSGQYSGIDPSLDDNITRPAAATPAKFFKDYSLSVLPELPPQDVYFLDGDHNYYTVLHELRLALKSSNHPLFFLHDVCWPWGRRDQYCAPDSIPAHFRHPCSASLGVLPGRNELGPGGFSGDASHYGYAAADYEGGPRNGVLSAIEDFIAERGGEEWQLLIVPVIFGLGILYSPSTCGDAVKNQIELLAKSLAPLSPLIELLERNRVSLFLNYLQSIREFARITEHSQSLLTSYNQLLAHTNSLQKSYEELFAAVRLPASPPPSDLKK
jgi:hypothetical protein